MAHPYSAKGAAPHQGGEAAAGKEERQAGNHVQRVALGDEPVEGLRVHISGVTTSTHTLQGGLRPQ